MDGAVKPRGVRPRDAAGLVIYRGHGDELEILLGRRAKRSRFMPNAFVFPGGRVDRADLRHNLHLSPLCLERLERHCDARLAHALAAAAIRETEEETGLVLQDGAQLHYLGRAITPAHYFMRFHARFFSAPATALSGDLAGSGELVDLAFYPLEEARQIAVVDVTQFMIERLVESLSITEHNAPAFMRYRSRATLISDD